MSASLTEEILCQVVGHFYYNNNQEIGVTGCYTCPSDIEPGHTATFDSFFNADDMSGNQHRSSYLLNGINLVELPSVSR
jgi:hypothetical protein